MGQELAWAAMGSVRVSPLGALGRGVIAGMAGTVAMDAVGYGRYRREGGDQALFDYELSRGLEGWEDAPAPAQVAKRVVEGLFQIELPASRAGLVNNLAHWAYGLAWAAAYGLAAGSSARPRAAYGLVLGPVVWASGYVVLPLAKLYKPIWEYDAAVLWKDLSAHLAYGLVTAGAFRLLAGGRRHG